VPKICCISTRMPVELSGAILGTGLAEKFKPSLDLGSCDFDCFRLGAALLIHRLQCSVSRHRSAQNARSIPDIHPSSLTVSKSGDDFAKLSTRHQQRVLPGGSFQAVGRFSLSRVHKAVIQLATFDPHC